MENYVKLKNTITGICNNSGLSQVEISGVLNECLSELRYAMLNKAIVENVQMKDELSRTKEDLQKLKEAEQSGIEHD